VDTGYVIRRAPVTASGKSRFGRYAISDPFLRFHFRFVASRLSQIALGQNMQASEELRQHWVDFIGRYTWEEICREWVLRASNVSGTVPLYPDRVDSAWTKDAQVDVVGVNFMQRHLILGECKWTNQREKASVLRALVESKTEKIIPPGVWQVFYFGFSKEGWNEPALSYAAVTNGTKPEEKTGSSQWRVVGMKLLSLADVDSDLAKWS
jgi:AAA+ ATPase superfamily predicted ATPase